MINPQRLRYVADLVSLQKAFHRDPFHASIRVGENRREMLPVVLPEENQQQVAVCS